MKCVDGNRWEVGRDGQRGRDTWSEGQSGVEGVRGRETGREALVGEGNRKEKRLNDTER